MSASLPSFPLPCLTLPPLLTLPARKVFISIPTPIPKRIPALSCPCCLSFPSLQSQATHQSMAGCPQPVRRSSAAESASKQSTNEQTARTAAAPPPHLRSKSPTPIIPVPHRTSHDMYNNPLYKFKLPATHSPVHNSVLHSCSPHKTGQNTPIKATPYT